jgi:hypothetical protein
MACLAAANQAAETDHYMKETIRDMIVVCMQVRGERKRERDR